MRALGDEPGARRDLNLEARPQAAVFEWIRWAAPQVFAFHPANGGWRSAREAARFRWIGLVAGVPDIVIIAPGARVHFIEMKAPGGTLSPAQRHIHETLTALGSPPAICRSIDDVRRAFQAWQISTREARP
jgi:hypothetical protein